MKKYLFILVIIFVTFLSGCTVQSTKPKHGLTFEDKEFEYSGLKNYIYVNGKDLAKYEIDYIDNGAREIGVYEVTAVITDRNTKEVVDRLSANITVKGELVSETFIYDGKEHSLSLNGEIANGFTVKYENNNQVNPGKYYVEGKLQKQDKTKVLDNYYGIMIIDYPENEEFEKYMDEFLVALLEGDQRSINFLFKNPEDYGLSHYEALLPTYESNFSYEEDRAIIKSIIDELKQFENEQLNLEQKDTYEIVLRYLNYLYSFTENMNYMSNSYLGSYLGFQCNLPLELAEYKFRNEQDIKDFISYLNHSLEAFKTYVEYTKDQIKYGYPMADNVIDNIVSSASEFVTMGEENFLITIFNEKIDNISFNLVDYTESEYKEQVKTAVLGPLTNAYKYLEETLPSLKGNCTTPSGLAGYGDEGVEYYLLEMSNVLGFNEIDGDELFNFVEDKFDEIYNKINNVAMKAMNLSQSEYMKFYNAVINGTPNFSNKSFEEVVNDFKYLSSTFVPQLSEMPNITIKNVPDALTDSFSPAAYFVSPIDETKEEVIYLNQAYTNDYNYIFTTLAHEGYPGHLYQNVYTKSLDINDVRRIIKCDGYVEGWATYVEIESYKYSSTYNISTALSIASEYLALDNAFSLAVNALFDLCIHYKGMNVEEVTEYLNSILGGNYTSEDFIDAYNQICEIPTNMSTYAISYFILDELRNYAQEELDDNFNIIEFNKTILDLGSAPLEMVVEEVYEYVNDLKYINQ